MDITYRIVNEKDIELLANTRVSLIDEDSGLNPDEKARLYQSCKEYMFGAIKSGMFIAFLAFDGENFAGTGSMCLYSVLPGKKIPNGKNAYIQNVYVPPEYRRHGVGKRIISLLTEEAAKSGYERITLHATTAGSALFKSCGFKVAEIRGLTEMIYIW